jgi:hypothetical protein
MKSHTFAKPLGHMHLLTGFEIAPELRPESTSN